MNEYIIVGFSKSKGFGPLSKMIQMFLGTEYSHVYIKVYNKYFEEYDIYQASKGMVNHLLDDNFKEYNIIVKEYKLNIEPEQKKDLLKYIRDRLGRPYSSITLITIFLIRMLKKLGVTITLLNKLFDGDKAYICSEFASRVIQYSNLVNIDTNIDQIDPKQLDLILERNKIEVLTTI